MQQRLLGATGLHVSRLGLGTMTWGRDTDEHEARAQLVAFVEAGGTLVDTAAGYTDGDSERLLGSLLGDVVPRDDVVVATKAGVGRRGGERFTRASRGHLLSSLDASLERLGVDHVDLWQVHTWVDDAPLEETLSALDLAQSSGRAAYVGVSNYNGWQSAQAATWRWRPRPCPRRGRSGWACSRGRRWVAAC
jgi:aryl-alcohol dehydrogenase-like predicted oxidoreductase